MAGYNRIVLMGNLTRDPEYKQLNSGQGVCKLGLATNRQFKNRQSGTMVQEVCYIDVDVWGPQADSCRQYLKKGRPVLVEGRLKLDSWEDAQGQSRSKHSIVADSVIFLSNGNGAETDVQDENPVSSARYAAPAGMPQPQSAAEQQLFEHIDQIKTRNTKKKKPAEPGSGELMFKDEPPFDDELPF